MKLIRLNSDVLDTELRRFKIEMSNGAEVRFTEEQGQLVINSSGRLLIQPGSSNEIRLELDSDF